MKTIETSMNNQLQYTVIDYSKAYVLNGTTLQLQTAETSLNEEENKTALVEKKFKSKKEFEQIVLQNGKILFGINSLLIDTKIKTDIEFLGKYIPDGIVFVFNEEENPKCYLIETMLSKQDFYGYLLPRMTGFFSQLNNKEMQDSFAELICKIVSKNHSFKKKLKTILKEEDVTEFIKRMLLNKPPVLLMTDNPLQELPEIMQVYDTTWRKCIKPFVLSKFSMNREHFCSLNPDFNDIDKVKDKVKVKVLKSTEEDHLKDVSNDISTIYTMIKTELLKTDKTIEFNPKQYYISIRKNKNLAFMQIGKKKISLVIVNPEKDTRKAIKHHEVKTLTEKVQRFWNGESSTVIIENADNLNEVILLLKTLVAKS